MSKLCEVCGKISLKGNQVPRGIGNRVTRRTITRRKPNLRTKRMKLGGSTVTLRLCASCLERMKKDGIITNPYAKSSK